MWIAKFKLKDDQDIYSPLCVEHKIDWFGEPYTHFVKDDKINLLVGGVLSGSEANKNSFVIDLQKDKRICLVERHDNFIIVHAQLPVSREAEAELEIFYNPQYLRVRPVHLAHDGWEYWEVGCLDRIELNKLVQAAIKYYHGKLISMKKEVLRGVTNTSLMPHLTPKQLEAMDLAFKEGYYSYPRKLTLPDLAKILGKSYSSFQEHLRRSENKLIEFFMKYR